MSTDFVLILVLNNTISIFDHDLTIARLRYFENFFQKNNYFDLKKLIVAPVF